MKRKAPLIFSLLIVVSMLLGVTRSSEKAPAKARTFEFSYSFTIKDLTSTARRVRIWIPLATSDQNQKLVIKKISSPVGTRASRERSSSSSQTPCDTQKREFRSFSLLKCATSVAP